MRGPEGLVELNASLQQIVVVKHLARLLLGLKTVWNFAVTA